ncbi:MAG: sigma 54-interacting transcriptional regulator, partial [Gemmataceae bacterium]|nr:sigma 54-interacting transcriptional regulator [Gemmataceae bacterium]
MTARLVLELGIGAPLTVLLSQDMPIKIGRNPDNDLIIQDEHASRFHAEVYFDSGTFFLKNHSKNNGTRLNGSRISSEVVLVNQCKINIGDAQIRFEDVAISHEDSSKTLPELELQDKGKSSKSDTFVTEFLHDELSLLFSYVADSVLENNPRDLVAKALEILLKRTQAEKVGFLSLDTQEIILKQVLPADTSLDLVLSKTLTKEVVAREKTVWLLQEQVGIEAESLRSMKDAVCLLVKTKASESDAGGILGAVHLYHSRRFFNFKEVRFAEFLVDCLANSLLVLRQRRALEADNNRFKFVEEKGKELIIGSSRLVLKMKQEIQRAALRNSSVLITGDSGVGKELVALELHKRSSRSAAPMVSVNCATISPGLADAELFGNEKGAYTGADRANTGYFQQADDGILFLDEVGELSQECQAKLLRTLESGKIRPLRGKEISVNVRVISATNRDLQKEVKEGRFREDLFYRLNTCVVKVPALKERLEDLAELVDFFLNRFSVEYRKRFLFGPEVLDKLKKYHWPGNIRQLKSVLESGVNRAESETLMAEDIDIPTNDAIGGEVPKNIRLTEVESWAIKIALERNGWNQTQAAK